MIEIMASSTAASFWPLYMDSVELTLKTTADATVALPDLDSPASKRHRPTPLDLRKSAIALLEPLSPINETNIQIEITPASPTSATFPQPVVKSGTLTRSGTQYNLAAALIENTPPSSSTDDLQPHKTPPTPSITNHTLPIPTVNLLVPPPPQLTKGARNAYLSSSDAVIIRKKNNLPPSPTCRNPFGPRFTDGNGIDRWIVTPEEIRTLAECFGESQVWTLNVEDVYCWRCVEETIARNDAVSTSSHLKLLAVVGSRLFTCWLLGYSSFEYASLDYAHYVERFLERSPEILKAYLHIRGRHDPGPCQHLGGIAHLMRQVGTSHGSRIKKILLTSTSTSPIFHTPNLVSSAISIIIQSFPNLQHATIQLPSSPSSTSWSNPKHKKQAHVQAHAHTQALIADGVAVRLARAFALLEKHLPEEEGLGVEGLEGQVVLEREWREVRRGWWVRRRAFGRKFLGERERG
ncbi:hypothetical protein VTL71DRAFT_2504 [Oculimacula yallundae]|uniref:Uncharacterized protein n=1 Tax=Oculimacula yallundae TaxID=86028 RepID=A0ABR4C934_9HELO